MGAEKAIRKQAQARSKKNAENEHAQDGVDKPSPHGQGQTWKRHSLRAQVDGRDGKIEGARESRGTKNRHADDPESDSRLRGNQKRAGYAEQRDHRGPQGKKIKPGKGHFARADLQWKKIIPEPQLRRRRQDQENHQRPVQHRQRGVAFRRAAKSGKKRDVHLGPGQMDAHDQRHGHAHKNAQERQPKVLQANGLVIGAKEVAGDEALPRLFRVISAAVVDDHGCSKRRKPRSLPRRQ